MSINIESFFQEALSAQDNSRGRSTQKHIGPSAIGGCTRAAWHILQGTPKINENTETYNAMIGTFIHAGIANAITRLDPFGDNYLVEKPLVAPLPSGIDLRGSVDLFVIDEGHVIDWKSVAKVDPKTFPSNQQWWQVMVYGWMLGQMGYDPKWVSLCAVPRNGKFRDVYSATRPYDEDTAYEALQWLSDVQMISDSNAPAPAPEKTRWFCSNYCSFFDISGENGCPSLG